MSLDKTKLDAKITSKLCNVLVNAQELVDDLEDLQEVGLFRQQLKGSVRNTLKICLDSVDKVFGVGQRKVIAAIKAKKSEDEIEAIRLDAELSNKEMLDVYEMAMKSRYEYRDLEFNERLLVLRVLKDIRGGNVKYLGDDLYYRIQSKEELAMLNNDSED